jgi:hypothetical protein
MGRAWTVLCILALAAVAAIAARTNSLAATVARPAIESSDSKAAANDVDFNRDVVPILSANCFKCHGPDPEQRKAGLRLDHRDQAVKPVDSGETPIVPGKPDKSELVRRIFSNDTSERMPPPESKKELTQAQKETLRRWIAAGAVYEPHWSFVAPKQSPLPTVNRKSWPKNPIDYFVLSRLEAAGLRPSPEADRYTLVRRVSLDLIGLPPTPAEADAFVHDTAPDAYERLVDRLLASPHYGERWARRWLDLARYSDTNGYEKDRPRSMWPYRDWVINALNSDMPFDEFTVEQLAGDLLPHATPDQKIATGFHRNTMLNEEGGIDPLEYRFYSLVDRNATTGATWLGLTVGCAQCHTHKFDPLTQTEYYRLMAFLNNADEPQMEVPNVAISKQRSEIEAKVARLTADLPNKFPFDKKLAAKQPGKSDKVLSHEALEHGFEAWQKQASATAVRWTVLRPDSMTSTMPILSVLPDNSVLASGDITKKDIYTLTFKSPPAGITALRLEVLPDDSLPNHGPGMMFYEGPDGDFFLSEINLAADGRDGKFNRAVASYSSGGDSIASAIDGDGQTGWSINGQQGKANEAIFNLAKPTAEAKTLSVGMLFERYHASALGHFRISVTTDPRAAQANPSPPTVEAALVVPPAKRTTAERDRLMQYYLSIVPELAAARAEIDQLRASMPNFEKTLVLRERPAAHPRPTFVHHRGEYLQTRAQVQPGVPEFLPPLPKGAPLNRLTLARWLVSRDNPLTARVTVNRQWAALFGRGIVRTTSDFGYQGDPPSHPKLLDWLAVEFMNRGWSMKQLDRLIVTSATYRQSSEVTSELLAKDPENVFLARGPRFRLDAELVRDAALRAAGLLSEKIGGPSVFPPQPPSVTSEGSYGALSWVASTGEDRYRRSLYTFSKRTAPCALYNTFDAPTGEACVARREVSNSPLQALMLMNDTVFMEADQAMGRTFAAEHASDASRASELFRRCLTRPPEADETAMLVDFVARERKRLKSDKRDAAKLAGGDGANVVERATWTAVARAVMNLDETITRH